MKIYVTLLIAIAIIMISGIMGEETSPAKEVVTKKIILLDILRKLMPEILNFLKNWIMRFQQWV